MTKEGYNRFHIFIFFFMFPFSPTFDISFKRILFSGFLSLFSTCYVQKNINKRNLQTAVKGYKKNSAILGGSNSRHSGHLATSASMR